MKNLLLIVVALASVSAFAGKSNKQVDAWIKEYFDTVPDQKAEWEAMAYARKVKVGMPHMLFDIVREAWTCTVNETWHEKTYRHQYVCAGALSKDKKDVQGKYFYAEGPWQEHNGDKVTLGKIVSIQN